MGLLTKEVEVTLHPANIDYYENLGYIIPRYRNKNDNQGIMRVKRGTTIVVKTNDLLPSSSVMVDIECDGCNELLHRSFIDYSRSKHGDKYYCQSCACRIFNSGENNVAWKSEKTDEQRVDDRTTEEYGRFIKNVLKRDNYTCRCCGKYGDGTILAVHHLDGYNWCVEKRTDVNNGITLCEKCHKSFHAYYGNGDNTKEQFEQWIKKPLEDLDDYIDYIEEQRKVICYETKQVFDSPHIAANSIGVNPQRIFGCCNRRVTTFGNKVSKWLTAKGKHYFWLDEYEKMTEKDFDEYFEWCVARKGKFVGGKSYASKQVILLETNEIFDSIADAVRRYSQTNTANISNCCKGKRNYCGILEDGRKMHWKYYSDYLESTAS